MKRLEDSLLQMATQRLVAEFQPDQIWLFGSHAWGNPHDGSDVDLLVVVSHSDETPIRRSQRAHRCLRGLRMPKDVLVERARKWMASRNAKPRSKTPSSPVAGDSMADTPVSEAKAWMVKAWRDIETARRSATGEPPFYDIAVYHCQQSAEKALKAFLVHHGKPYEKTHDIEVLVDLPCEIDANLSQLADAADVLTPHASRFRYPNATFAVEPQPGEFNEALQHAKSVYEFVFNLLPADARP